MSRTLCARGHATAVLGEVVTASEKAVSPMRKVGDPASDFNVAEIPIAKKFASGSVPSKRHKTASCW